MRRLALFTLVCLCVTTAAAAAQTRTTHARRSHFARGTSSTTRRDAAAGKASWEAAAHKSRRQRVGPMPRSSTVTALLGNSTVQPIDDDVPAGLAEAFPFTAGASGSVASINIYVAAGTRASQLIAGLYTDRSAGPSQLVASGTVRHA